MSSTGKPKANHGGAGADHKTRILTHMNADHAENLSHYLRHYNGVGAAAAASARLEDITLEEMVISYANGSKTASVRLDPPLGTLHDAQKRLVEMAYTAAEAQGLDLGARVKTYVPPGAVGIVNTVGLFFGLWALGTRDALAPEGWLARYVPAADVLREWRWWALTAIVSVHVFEAAVIMRPKAWRHCERRINVFGFEDFGPIGWMWVISPVFEGFPAFGRFNKLVKEQQEKTEQLKKKAS